MANHWHDDGRKLLKDDPNNPGLDWTNRELYAANFISTISPKKVFDFGCGDCGISKRIDDNIEYVGFDSVAHTEGIVLIDFNLNLPVIQEEGVATCLGILEYLDDKKAFIEYLYQNFTQVVFSCRDRDRVETIGLFEGAGFTIQVIAKTDPKPSNQTLYYAEK